MCSIGSRRRPRQNRNQAMSFNRHNTESSTILLNAMINSKDQHSQTSLLEYVQFDTPPCKTMLLSVKFRMTAFHHTYLYILHLKKANCFSSMDIISTRWSRAFKFSRTMCNLSCYIWYSSYTHLAMVFLLAVAWVLWNNVGDVDSVDVIKSAFKWHIWSEGAK